VYTPPVVVSDDGGMQVIGLDLQINYLPSRFLVDRKDSRMLTLLGGSKLSKFLLSALGAINTTIFNNMEDCATRSQLHHREMELLSSLNPNIASYVTCAVNKADSTFRIMTEYLPAGSLYGLIRVSAPSVAVGLKYARGIASGLHSYLHSRSPPILHLDVSPRKVLMTTEGSCKLVDFGTSTFFSEADASIGGSAHYMTPETVLGEFSPASDIYSLGITVLHMLMGRPPWDHMAAHGNAFLMAQPGRHPTPHNPRLDRPPACLPPREMHLPQPPSTTHRQAFHRFY
jgi:serine/threonine protein kinase